MNRKDLDELPKWLRDLWSVAPNIARQAEKHISDSDARVAELEAADEFMQNAEIKAGDFLDQFDLDDFARRKMEAILDNIKQARRLLTPAPTKEPQ